MKYLYLHHREKGWSDQILDYIDDRLYSDGCELFDFFLSLSPSCVLNFLSFEKQFVLIA